MDYEQKYKEAIKRAKAMIKVAEKEEEVYKSAITIFPELEESEDERIRREIIKLVHFFYCSSSVYEHHVSEDDMIAWLEKQGEQPSWSEEDEYQLNTILHGLDLKRELYKKEGNKVEEKRYKTQYDWLKSIKPNHWKPSEEQMEALNAINNIGELSYAGQADLLIKLYNDLEKL